MVLADHHSMRHDPTCSCYKSRSNFYCLPYGYDGERQSEGGDPCDQGTDSMGFNIGLDVFPVLVLWYQTIRTKRARVSDPPCRERGSYDYKVTLLFSASFPNLRNTL